MQLFPHGQWQRLSKTFHENVLPWKWISSENISRYLFWNYKQRNCKIIKNHIQLISYCYEIIIITGDLHPFVVFPCPCFWKSLAWHCPSKVNGIDRALTYQSYDISYIISLIFKQFVYYVISITIYISIFQKQWMTTAWSWKAPVHEVKLLPYLENCHTGRWIVYLFSAFSRLFRLMGSGEAQMRKFPLH